MESLFDKKADINKVLEKETTHFRDLKEVLYRSSQVATSVGTILESFEHRLAKLETTILPVYQQTGNLQRRQYNIEKTLKSLDYVIDFYNVAGQVESIIRDRPVNVGISTYLDVMNKLHAACKYFETNNPQSIELENVTTLFDVGVDSLSKEFRDELKKYQKPIPVMTIVDLVENIEFNEELLLSIEIIPLNVREDLRKMALWLDEHTTSDRLTVYAKLRSDAVIKSLKALHDYDRSCSLERGNRVTAHGSPLPLRAHTTKTETPKNKTNKISNVLERTAQKMLLKAVTSQTKWQNAGTNQPFSPLSFSGSPAVINEEGIDVNDVLVYINQVTALHRLGYLELLLAEQIVPSSLVPNTFEVLLRDPMDQLVGEGENLASQAKRCVSRGDLQALLSILALLRHMDSMQSQYEQMLMNCHVSMKSKFMAIVNILHETCLKALDSYVDGIKNDSEKALPKDGTVHQLTSNVLIFVENLLDYVQTLMPIFQRDRSLIVMLPNNTLRNDQAKALMGCYIKRVLSNLGHSLVHRSEAYGDPYLRTIFRLNNYNYILKALQSSDLLTFLNLVESDCEGLYNKQILEQKTIYSQSWSRVLSYISNQDEVPQLVIDSGKLKDKERQLIKDMLSGFNKEMEEIRKVQRSYSIPDRELRESLKRDNKEFILPTYQAFYDRFVNVSFSKNPEKYIKYSPVEVSNMIDTFFDVAA